tara:strand:- start:62 stop:760 length:699 start_codon:yes stop_codon:yes gene_type:complete
VNSKINVFLISLLISFCFLSLKKINIIYTGFSEFGLLSEFSLLEATQVFVLILCVTETIKSRNLIIKCTNKLIFILRNLFFIFLIWEEISFLTRFLIRNPINRYGEWNFHNSNFFYSIIFEHIPILRHNPLTDDLYGYMLFNIIALFLIGYGSYFNKFNAKYNLFFLSKRLSIFSQAYILNLLLTYLLRYLFPQLNFLIDSEYIELYIYILLLIDVKLKNKKFNKYIKKKDS